MTSILSWLNAPCRPLDDIAAEAARQRQDQLTKPRGSLGRLEELAIRLAGMQGTATPSVDPVQILQFVSDHGVAAEGVSAFPQAVTLQMLHNIARGGAAISVMADALGARMEIFDLGIATDPGPVAGVRAARLGPGTGNIAREPAMTASQLAGALNLGRAAVEQALDQGAGLLICGEMGIANTTPATALACALLGIAPGTLVGPGTGLDPAGIARKTQAIEKALALHATSGCTPLDLLGRLGGFDIAATVGAFITAAQRGLPILVDGFIITAAALAAVRLQPATRGWMLFSHGSAEPGHRLMMQALDADPLLDLGLRLGEGSGAAAAVPLLRLACAVHAKMATFAEAGVSASGD
ncbi:nicotinate-nucleotide--dimethylbenzimidazole phosphoribosyltransferase [Thiobaca trueperi]|uniref:Nicotinate-nucleotide--dimethylbenzimidazole phosphoribosyltransferase n=1 Tax=Thiobaca trueperi TaxID=127458 RepID=A0A4R3MVV0_9GAMM|nr:nicotinate-nucleotide--dimethylbenzimidazole phosphoribosyltransferase [Thiobaca trueperi]TCT19541.1 nicotinate-nucleotide-dimethylbenzimidazole phosphoribosyltransferase [Thiobaca trueperi]